MDVTTEVAGRTLRLTNLAKVLYPSGFTKGEVVDYYRRIAPVLLPHVAGRPATRVRFPNGTDAPRFFEKNVPAGTPDWVRVHRVDGNRESTTYPLVDDLPTLVWLANLAALELHVPQWRTPAGRRGTTLGDDLPVDRLVVDLDPGPGVGMPLIAAAALLVAGELGDDGLVGHVKTSGSKGLQVYAALRPTPVGRVLAHARALGERLTAAHPEVFVTEIARAARPGRILVDVNQNLPGRTTVAAYSLRGQDSPTVSTPLTWGEVEDAAAGGSPLRFEAADVLARVAERGDLFAPLLTDTGGVLPA